MRLLGFKLSHGFSSEVRVFATLLRHRGGAYDPAVFYNCLPGASQGSEAFESLASAPAWPIDAGWRPSPEGARPLIARLWSRVRLYGTLPTLLRRARAFAPDVVYSSQQKWDCLAASHVARRLAKPHVVHLLYSVGPWLGRQSLERLRSCEHVVAVSDFIRAEALDHGVAPGRVTTIRNTVPVPPPSPPGMREQARREFGIPLHARTAGIVARLEPSKGQADTIEAFGRVVPQVPGAFLLVVGEGHTRGDLEDRARRTGFADRIRFTGERHDLPVVLAALDVFAHPSRRDAAPLAVLEASAAGLPVVAYADGGVAEIVVDGRTGLLAPTGDTAALAGAMEALLADPARSAGLGAAGRAHIAQAFRPEDAGREFARLATGLTAR